MLIMTAVVYDEPPQKNYIDIDERLLTETAGGSREAFCRLYELASNAVYTYALSVLRDRYDAEEAMQDTFLKIRSAAHLYRPQGKPMAWILTITRNICLMELRRRGRSISMDASANADAMQMEAVDADARRLGTDRIRDTEDRMVLETAFRCLSDEDLRIVVLHAVSGLKHREIAELMQLPLATILSKYNRALKKLRENLEGRF